MYIDELSESKRLILSAVSGLDSLQIPYHYGTHHCPKYDPLPMSTPDPLPFSHITYNHNFKSLPGDYVTNILLLPFLLLYNFHYY